VRSIRRDGPGPNRRDACVQLPSSTCDIANFPGINPIPICHKHNRSASPSYSSFPSRRFRPRPMGRPLSWPVCACGKTTPSTARPRGLTHTRQTPCKFWRETPPYSDLELELHTFILSRSHRGEPPCSVLTVSSRDAGASRRALWSVAPTLVATRAHLNDRFPQPHGTCERVSPGAEMSTCML
jgi:hypothetical protein